MTHTEGAVRLHLDHLRVRNLRPASIYNRRRTLARLAAWVEGPVLYLGEQDLKRWQADRSGQVGAPTVRMELSNIREFYCWAIRERLRDDDPTIRLPMPRVPRRLPRPISDTALAHAMSTADPGMHAILALAGFAGLRAGEIARLDWSEVGLHDTPPMIRVVDGKGGHERLVPLSPALAAVLTVLPSRRGPVIHRLDGKAGHAEPHRISQRANDHLHESGARESLHQLRHRLGTVAYRACRDLRALQEILGHQSPSSTAGYCLGSSEVGTQAIYDAGTLAA